MGKTQHAIVRSHKEELKAKIGSIMRNTKRNAANDRDSAVEADAAHSRSAQRGRSYAEGVRAVGSRTDEGTHSKACARKTMRVERRQRFAKRVFVHELRITKH